MDDINFYDDYYNKFDHKLSSREQRRIYKTISLIPNDVNTVLEVGCGDGRLINPLIGKYKKVCGLDISKKALEHVEAIKVRGRIENLPFEDNSFDIVLCCEVLEHLPISIYKKSIKEIERVAKKYIIVSVPNNEDIEISKIRCPYCGCNFHPHRHLRSYDDYNLKKLFPNFKTKYSDVILNDQKKYPKILITIYKLLKRTDFPEMALCPQCGYFNKVSTEINHKKGLRSLSKLLNPFISNKNGGWLVFLYEKK